MTACDYKFSLAQAAHTKTLELQQKKGQSKPSSPSYYKKSLVPAGAFAFITIVQAGENKNNSRHSKINPRLISPRLSLEIKTVDHTGRECALTDKDWNVAPQISPGCTWRSPLQSQWKEEKKKISIPHVCSWRRWSILSEVPLGAHAFAGSIFAVCF